MPNTKSPDTRLVPDKKLPDTGLVRLKTILEFVPVSRSLWYSGMRDGRFPKPVKQISARVTCWRAEDIRALFDTVDEGDR